MISLELIDPGDPGAAEQLDRACRELGFFRIPASLLPNGVVAQAQQAAAAFFDLDVEAKQRLAFPRPGYPYGYSPFRYETLAASLGESGSAPDLKESFSVGPDCREPVGMGIDPGGSADGPEGSGGDPGEGNGHRLTAGHRSSAEEQWFRSPSLWPSEPEGFRTAWERCYRALSAVSADLLSLMAVALDLPERHFDPLIDRSCSAMRALNYPALTEPPPLGSLRAGAHSDYGTLTVLVTDDVPGLEVQRPDRTWQPVGHHPDSYVVNLGDSIARWTNDRWRSTLHRVTVVSPQRRQSLAFFHIANWDATIDCLPSCHGPDNPPRYQPVQAGPWLMEKFTRSVE